MLESRSLKEHRLTRGLSHRALGELAGVSNKTLSDIELGKVIPKLRTIRRICDAFEIEPMEVVEFRAAIERGLAVPRKAERPEA